MPVAIPTITAGSFTRVGAAGAVTVGNVAAGDTCEIYAIGNLVGPTIAKIGQRVGPGIVALNFTAFTFSIFGGPVIPEPAPIFAVTVDPAGNYSAPSATTLPKIFEGGSTLSISGLHRNPAGDELHLTVAGLPTPGSDTMIFVDRGPGAITLEVFTGPGAKIITGLVPNQRYNCVAFAQNEGGQALVDPVTFWALPVAAPGTFEDFVKELAEDAATRWALIMGQTCFYNHEPDVVTADPIAVFIGTGGPTNRIDKAWMDLTVQVRVLTPVRAYVAGKTLAEALYDTYHGGLHFSLPHFEVAYSEAMQRVYAMGRDERGREVFNFNLSFSAREA